MMKTKRIEAVLNSNGIVQEIDCIQLGTLYICSDKTNNMGHLVYGQEDWIDELRHNGFRVDEMEVVLDVRDSTFNELELKHYELDECEIYLFSDLAVKIGGTLEVFCQKDITINDAIRKWGIQTETGELFSDREYTIPKNMNGKQAVGT